MASTGCEIPGFNSIHTFIKVEFAAPVGYEEPQRPQKAPEPQTDEPMVHPLEANNFVTFSGAGNRLDGKKKKCEKVETQTVAKVDFFGKFLLQADVKMLLSESCSWNS